MKHICWTSTTFGEGITFEEAYKDLLLSLEDENVRTCKYKHVKLSNAEDGLYYWNEDDEITIHRHTEEGGDYIIKSEERFFNEDKSYISFGTKVNRLGNDEIAEHLMSDKSAYGEFMKEYLTEFLDKHSDKSIYWDAWFRGARGKELEDADKGKVFKE